MPKTVEEYVIATNSACIDSKRCVEKLYLKQDYGCLRYFVKKYRRRSPLISRGYYIRMKAVKDAVESFIDRSSSKRKVIVNLGCGYDVLAFQLIEEKGLLGSDVLFVDVDHQALTLKKCEVIQQTSRLLHNLPEAIFHPERQNSVNLLSANYAVVGCDLSDLPRLELALGSLFDANDASVMFVGEVSIVYMKTDLGDSLIKWASSYPEATFFMLQQYLPEGDQHPFAETMLKHFSKLQSPLTSIRQYQTLSQQEERFYNRGWSTVAARSLWTMWNDEHFMNAEQRRSLDRVEPFDEWEEFVLYCSHYFCLTATNVLATTTASHAIADDDLALSMQTSIELNALISQHPRGIGQRRNGALLKLNNNTLLHHGGYGFNGRLLTWDVYSRSNIIDLTQGDEKAHAEVLPKLEVVCHAAVRVSEEQLMIIGGRTSPERASSLCFVGTSKVDSLPHGLFRHCAVLVHSLEQCDGKRQAGVLVFGGKTGAGKVLDTWMLWEHGNGWRNLEVEGRRPPPRFGASMISVDVRRGGYLTGGLSQDGTVVKDFWEWELIGVEGQTPAVRCYEATSRLSFLGVPKSMIFRFGAVLIPSSRKNATLLIGGVASSGVISGRHELLSINRDLEIQPCRFNNDGPRPLLIGFSAINVRNDILLVGGGGVCFSFGTCWNSCLYQLTPLKKTQPSWLVQDGNLSRSKVKLADILPTMPQTQRWVDNVQVPQAPARLPPLLVPRVRVHTAADFERLVADRKPVVVHSLNLGTCLEKWNLSYLCEAMDRNKLITVHRCSSPYMSFLAKNFEYLPMTVAEFVRRIERGEHLYLRSISTESPNSIATHLAQDFPRLAADFILPPELRTVSQSRHSSPLRISSNVMLALHFDVLANILCQIRGEKKLTLYAPEDGTNLRFPPGSSSSTLNIFDASTAAEAGLGQVQCYEATLGEGDVLFIPPLWAHAAKPSQGLSIAVNVFFRDLDCDVYAAGRDVYGNRDLKAYDHGRRDVQKILRAFQGLPRDVAGFYIRRLAEELLHSAQ